MSVRDPGSQRNNAFDSIRLLLAILVVYSHAHLLGGFGEEGLSRFCKGQTFAGDLAVIGFFGISGFLVTASFAIRNDWLQFVKARLLRIIPGFYFALVVTAFGIAPLIARLNIHGGPWVLSSAWHFVLSNALVNLSRWNVGEVLRGLPYPGSINGSLWSLFPEICCYGGVLFIGVIGWIRNSRGNGLVLCAAILILNAAIILSEKAQAIAPTLLTLTGWAPFIAAFLVGSSLYCFRDRLDIGRRSSLGWLAVAILLLKFGGWALLGPIVLPFVLINLAYSFRLSLPFDLSYGTYVLHFPVLQLLAAIGLNRYGFTTYFSLALIIVFPLSLLSWFAIEKPFLGLKAKATATA
ncbi:MAG TPA: acyltransferase [Opitutaceae bacterium]|jgi:peptidoglycan/LPS O-acetylase OafA/YrhL